MNTLLLRVDEADAAGDYPVRLYAADLDKGDALPKRAAASGKLPRTLALPNAVRDPATNAPLTFEAVRDAYDEDALFGAAPAAAAGQRLQAMGAFLFRLLLGGKLEAAWRAQVAAPGVRRVYLDVVPRELRAAPWELLFDPLTGTFLFNDRTRPMLRGGPGPEGPVCDWPIRVLVVVAAREAAGPGDGGLALAQERDALHAAFERMRQSVEVEFCTRPSRADLQRVIREVRPHVLHFMGHGRKADAGTGEAALHVHGPTDWDWTVPELKADLAGGDLTFAFLNACHSADPAVREGVAAVADALLDLGARAVVGMQRAVADAAAASMAGTFYDELAAGRPVDQAVTEMRVRATPNDAGYSRFDAATAVLTCRTLPDRVLPRYAAAPPREIEHFIDRQVERREFRRRVDPIRDGYTQPHNLLVLHGRARAGKSGLVQWCLQHCYARDAARLVRYVDLSQDVTGPGQKNYLDVLRHIRDNEGTMKPLRARLPAPAFSRFNAELNALLRKQPLPTGGWERVVVEDEGGPLPAEAPIENFVEHIFGSFRSALVQAAGGRPLIIAIDHMSQGAIPELFRTAVCEYLIQPFANDPAGLVRFILVATTGEDEKYGVWDLRNKEVIELRPFAREQFYEYAMEYCRLQRLDETKARTMVAAIAQVLIQDTWSPSTLLKTRAWVTGEGIL